MRTLSLVVLVLATVVVSIPSVEAATPARNPNAGKVKVYRWTDDQGQVHYGNTLPPSEASRASQELNAAGRVVSSTARTLTPEERAAEAAALEASKAHEQEALAQQKSDERLLLYNTVDELIKAQREARMIRQQEMEQIKSDLRRLQESLMSMMVYESNLPVRMPDSDSPDAAPTLTPEQEKNRTRMAKVQEEVDVFQQRLQDMDTALLQMGVVHQQEIERYGWLKNAPKS